MQEARGGEMAPTHLQAYFSAARHSPLLPSLLHPSLLPAFRPPTRCTRQTLREKHVVEEREWWRRAAWREEEYRGA